MSIETKLYHADCRDIFPTIADNSIDLVVCDLPYEATKCKWDIIIPFEDIWPAMNRICKPTTPIILFGKEPFSSHARLSNLKDYRYDLVWEKTAAGGFFNAKKQPMIAHENLMVFYKKPGIYNPQKTTGHKPVNSYTKKAVISNKTEIYGKVKRDFKGGGSTERYPRSVLKFKSDKQTCKLHVTQKPLALCEWLVKTYSNPGALVLDFAMGSGTTGVACLKAGRSFIGVDDDIKSYETAWNRIAQIKLSEGL